MRSVLKKKSFNRVLAVIMCFAMLMVSAFATVGTASAAADDADGPYTAKTCEEGDTAEEWNTGFSMFTEEDGTSAIKFSAKYMGHFDLETAESLPQVSKFDHWEITGSYTLKDGDSLNNTSFTIYNATSDIIATAYFVPVSSGTDPTVPSADNKTANVKYSVEPTYMVNIPATVTLGSTSTISSEDVVVEKGKQVEVTLTGTSEDDNSFKLKSAEGAEIEYTIKNNDSAVSLNDKVLIVNPDSSSTGDSTLSFVAPSDVTYSGSYTGTVTFNVAVANTESNQTPVETPTTPVETPTATAPPDGVE